MRSFNKWTQIGAGDAGSTIEIQADGRLARLISTNASGGRAYLRRTIAAVPRSVVTLRVLARNVSGAASIIFDYPAAAQPVRRTEIVSGELIEYVVNWQVPAAATTGTVSINVGVFSTQEGNCEIYDAKIEVDGVDIDTVGDWVVEEGSNPSGSFSRFASGLLICRKTLTGLGPINQVWGSGFDSEAIGVGAWAAPFVEPPARSADAWSPSGLSVIVVGASRPSATSGGAIRLARFTSSLSTDFGVDVTGTGRWFA